MTNNRDGFSAVGETDDPSREGSISRHGTILAPFASDIKTLSFVCMNNDGFDGLRRPRHILMQRLSRMGFRALFVSTAVTHFSQRFSSKALRFGGVKKINDRLRWYQPPFFLSYGYGRWFEVAASAFRQLFLRIMISLFTGKERIFFITVPDPDFIRSLRAETAALVIYNVHDRYVDSRGDWIGGHYELAKRADVILCTSRSLLAELLAIKADSVFLFPPGVDFDLFPRHLKFKRRAAVRERVIGCVGNLGIQIDWKLMAELAEDLCDYKFRFIGPAMRKIQSNKNFLKFTALSNVEFYGAVPHSDVPEMIAQFDVCIMPYVMDQYTAGINPLKLYEYFALGKPVVTTPIPEMQQFGSMVYMATGTTDWKLALAAAAAENSEEKFEERRQIALSEDYEKRVAFLLETIHAIFSRRWQREGNGRVEGNSG